MDILNAKLQDHWQPLAIQLGFQDDEIEYYEDFPKNKQADQMLTVWMERDGTIPAFISALERANLPSNVLSTVMGLLHPDQSI